MNYFKSIIRIIKRLIHEEIYSNPEEAVKRYRKKGVIIGSNTQLYNTSIDNLRPFLVTIGNNTLITGTKILTHDASTKKSLGYTKLGSVTIGDNVFIGLGCIVLPNVTIGNRVVVGAGTVVSKNIPDNSVVAGNPMKIIGTYEDMVLKNENLIKDVQIFQTNYSMNVKEQNEMREYLKYSLGFTPSKD